MQSNPFLDLAVFPDSQVDPMTLRTFIERSQKGHEMTSTSSQGSSFMMTYSHEESDGKKVLLKIRGSVDERNMGSLLPAPVVCFFYDKDSLAPSKSASLYSDRPSHLFNEDEGRRYLEACKAAWDYISIHSTLRRGDL